MDEGSATSDRRAWQNFIGRLRLPTFQGKYQGLVTGNPNGRDWIFDFFFNSEIIENMICGKPDCPLSPVECNKKMRRKRRGIHCTSYQNTFLPPDYLEQMVSSFSEEERQRYLDGSFDCFEGAIFREFSHELHVLPI
jgi:hypothetical protein